MMTRTTIAFDDDLLQKLKEESARRGTGLARLVNDLVRRALADDTKAAVHADLAGRWRTFECGPPAVSLYDRDALWEVMESSS